MFRVMPVSSLSPKLGSRYCAFESSRWDMLQLFLEATIAGGYNSLRVFSAVVWKRCWRKGREVHSILFPSECCFLTSFICRPCGLRIESGLFLLVLFKLVKWPIRCMWFRSYSMWRLACFLKALFYCVFHLQAYWGLLWWFFSASRWRIC